MIYPSSEEFLREHALAIKLNRIGDLLRDELDVRLSSVSLKFHQMNILVATSNGFATTPTEMSRLLGIDSAVITRALNDLEARNFIRKTRSLSDRRSVQVALTDSGGELLARICDFAFEVLHARLGQVAAPELDQLTNLVNRLLSS